MPPGLAVSLKLAVLRVSTLPGLFSPTAVVEADEGLVVAVLLLAGCRYMLVATQFSPLAGGFTSRYSGHRVCEELSTAAIVTVG